MHKEKVNHPFWRARPGYHWPAPQVRAQTWFNCQGPPSFFSLDMIDTYLLPLNSNLILRCPSRTTVSSFSKKKNGFFWEVHPTPTISQIFPSSWAPSCPEIRLLWARQETWCKHCHTHISSTTTHSPEPSFDVITLWCDFLSFVVATGHQSHLYSFCIGLGYG